MKRIFLLLALALALPGIAQAQRTQFSPEHAVVAFKYSRSIGLWSRGLDDGELIPGATGELYRTFPTGPKISFADERIPEGIYQGEIDPDGNIAFVFNTYPHMPEFNEVYRLTGPSLDRNVIPVRGEMIDVIRDAAREMLASGHRTITLVILPGSLEPEVAEMLEKARNVREGQTLDDVEKSIRRWKHVEEYLIRTGRIPQLRFDGDRIEIIEADDIQPRAFAGT